MRYLEEIMDLLILAGVGILYAVAHVQLALFVGGLKAVSFFKRKMGI